MVSLIDSALLVSLVAMPRSMVCLLQARREGERKGNHRPRLIGTMVVNVQIAPVFESPPPQS